jgi:hypothetical protein
VRYGRSQVARWLTVGALLLAAVGFELQVLAGVTNTPTIPPGLLAIVASAGLVALSDGRWLPAAGPVVGILSLAGFFVVVGGADRLVQTETVAGITGAWLMVLGLAAASILGAVAVARDDQASQP